MEKYLVSLDDAERAALLDVTRKGKAAARRIAHARILLLADEGRTDDEIAATVAIGTRTVSRVRKRLVSRGCFHTLSSLSVAERIHASHGGKR